VIGRRDHRLHRSLASRAKRQPGERLHIARSPFRCVAVSPFHLYAALVLLYLTAPLLFCLLVSVADSTTIETPMEAGRLSLRWYEEFLSDARWVGGLFNSLQIAAMTVPLALLCGTTAALAFERWRFRGRTLLGVAILTPLFVPPVVLGMQSLALHQRIGLWGTPLSIAVAHSLWATPLVFTVMRAALALVPPELDEAARGLGASPLRAILLVTLPLITPALVISIFFAFIVSVNEFVMALFLATPRTQTLPTLIWPQVRYNLTPIVAAASGVTILVTIAVLVVADRLFDLRRLLAAK
jgi:ABC-type spermidine/putrescine transport system permease subunit II